MWCNKKSFFFNWCVKITLKEAAARLETKTKWETVHHSDDDHNDAFDDSGKEDNQCYWNWRQIYSVELFFSSLMVVVCEALYSQHHDLRHGKHFIQIVHSLFNH